MRRASLGQKSIQIFHYSSWCRTTTSLCQTRISHAKVLKGGLLQSNTFVANSLADAYCKSGSIPCALRVFEEISNPNVVSWNLLISGYNYNFQFDGSMKVFCNMQLGGFEPDLFTYGSVLSACAESGYVCFGRQIYALVLKNGFLFESSVCTGLVSMFSKSCDFEDCLKVFSQVSPENVVCYNAVISGCIMNGEYWMALDLFHQMLHQFLVPSDFTLSSALTTCTALGELGTGRQIHARVLKCGFDVDLYVGTTIVGLYAKWGDIDDAVKVFSQMPIRNVVTWTAIISSFVQAEDSSNSLKFFKEMKESGEEINNFTLTSVLRACSKPNMIEEASQIHCLIVKIGFYLDLVVRDALINAYAKTGEVNLAKMVFDEMGFVNHVQSWAVMIAGFAQNHQLEQSVELFRRMFSHGKLPDKFCTSSVLSIIIDVEFGMQVHAYIVKGGLLQKMTVSSALLTMYCKCDCLPEAYGVFKEMPEKDGVAWTSMIVGFTDHGCAKDAFWLFRKLVLEKELKLDQTTIAAILATCSVCQSLKKGKEVHGHLIRIGFGMELICGGALVNMYSKCRSLDSAVTIFHSMPQKDQAAWTSLVSGFAQNAHFEEALDLFRLMVTSGVRIDCFTISSVIGVLGDLTRPVCGEQLHALSIKTGWNMDLSVSSSLVSMYSKLGSIENSRKVFDQIEKPDLVTWTSMIVGCAQHGRGLEALKLYELMRKEGLKPDSVTFGGILSACSRNGLVDEGYSHFNSMCKDYGLAPELQHYACMVDLLSRAGRLNEAVELIVSMPTKPDAFVWGTLLGACKVHGDDELGRLAARKVLEEDPTDDGAYVSLSNIHADMNDWEEVAKVRKLMKNTGVKKVAGSSFT